jgi:hypothetical protein
MKHGAGYLLKGTATVDIKDLGISMLVMDVKRISVLHP